MAGGEAPGEAQGEATDDLRIAPRGLHHEQERGGVNRWRDLQTDPTDSLVAFLPVPAKVWTLRLQAL
jgi:hypothetical protein